ncbi:uncharacterized protein SPSC_05099 [Sporisorium scitamineum]|uniref:Uncharacterized protein n=1 Tax=Sporisorium scitamineum TaxID=49012 RepID=A0A0F7S3X6_9BASI|nr:uncharacterized protein SPSC_05099 [Sporisorium scitamineum]CDW97056.1 hypothetical protein [Sporisorium scitamineum]
MSIQQGLISPPLSGRTYKADQPRVQNIHKAGINAVDVFGHASSTSSSAHHTKPFEHTIRSPVKKHHDGLSDADRAQRPLTPPMSKDVRHNQHESNNVDPAGHRRTDSEGDHLDAPASSSSNTVDVTQSRPFADQRASLPVPTSRAGLMAAAPIGNSFRTLTQGFECESDDEHNPFLDRRPTTTSTSSASHAHHSHPYYDDFDSDQDADGSVDGDPLDCTADHDATPRASASSSNATTPPPAPRHTLSYRPARPFSERVRVNNAAVTSTMPIRDTPKNPFLAGGPADNGFHGPNRHAAYRRAQQIPGKERGKIAYVFRGQRVTYADPEYDSDDDDSELDELRAKTNEFNPHHNPERPPRLQPRLLFPPNASISQPEATTSKQPTAAQMGSGRSQTATAYPRRAVQVVEEEFGGATSRNSYDDEESHAPRTGGGMFAAQIAAQRKQQMAAQSHTVYSHGSQSSSLFQNQALNARGRGETTAPSSSARLQSITRDGGADGRRAARDALLARLDQTNWSDDDEGDDDHRDRSYGRWREGSQGTAPADEHEEQRVQTHALARSQSHRKRLSAHELQPGHAGEVDVLGRPMKRSRASYAY